MERSTVCNEMLDEVFVMEQNFKSFERAINEKRLFFESIFFVSLLWWRWDTVLSLVESDKRCSPHDLHIRSEFAKLIFDDFEKPH